MGVLGMINLLSHCYFNHRHRMMRRHYKAVRRARVSIRDRSQQIAVWYPSACIPHHRGAAQVSRILSARGVRGGTRARSIQRGSRRHPLIANKAPPLPPHSSSKLLLFLLTPPPTPLHCDIHLCREKNKGCTYRSGVRKVNAHPLRSLLSAATFTIHCAPMTATSGLTLSD